MKTFDGVLLCTDLDGTLFCADKSVSSENLDAIRRFQEKGGRFTFITGRAPSSARNVWETVRPNAAVGCFNGAGIFDYEKNDFLRLTELAPEFLTLISLVDREMPEVGIQLNGAKHVYLNKENEALRLFYEITGIDKVRCHYTEVKDRVAKAIFLHLDGEVLERLAVLLSSHPLARLFDFIRSEETIYEILPKGVSKGGALLQLAEIYGIDPARTIAVGDFDNDVSMLRAAGLGVAVANASEAAKRAADLITVSNEENAIARIIRDLEDGKIEL